MTWETVLLGDVLKTSAGGTPLKSKKEYYEGGDIPWLMSGEVCRRDIISSVNKITKLGVENSSAKVFPINTTLVAMYGATAGQVGILRFPSATNQAVCGILPNSNYLPEFLYYYLTHYKKTLLLEASGVAQPNLSQIKIKNVPIPKISIQEQQKIVIKLDAIFGEIDKAIVAIEANAKNSEALFESYLTEVFERGGEGWISTVLDKVCKVDRGSSPRPIKDYFTDSAEGVNWIKIGDTEEGGKYIFSTKQKITKEGAEKSRYVEAGDFILTNSMSYGRPYIMRTNGYVHDGWFVLRLNKDIDSEYFYYLLTSPYVQNQFNSLAAGSVVKNISGDLVKKTILPIPSLNEQKKLAEIFSEKQAILERLSDVYTDKANEMRMLKESTLNQAFSGELVKE